MKKKFRIKKNIEIQQLIQINKTVGNKYFIIYYNENHDNDNFRYAIGVSKKLGNAVTRNLIKRRIREIIKNFNILSSVEFFVVARREAVEASFDNLKQNLEILLKKANLLRK